MKSIKMILKFIILPIAIILLLFYLWPQRRLDVEYTQVKYGSIEEVVTPLSNAVLQADRSAHIRASTAGEIEKIMFRKGDRVKKGDLIIRLKNDEQYARLKLAEANLRAGLAQLKQTRIRSSSIKKSLARAERLFSEKVVSESNLDQAKTESESIDEALNISEANLSQLEAQLRIARSLYENTFIRAPFDGTISDMFVEEGEYLVLGTPVYDIYSHHSFYLSAQFDEVDASKITTGMRVKLKSDALPDRIIEGRVRWISPIVSTDIKASRGVEVYFDLQNIEPGMRLGMTFEAEVVVNTKENVKYLPSQVIIGMYGEEYVYVISGNTSQKRYVETGLSNWERTEILNGVSESDRVIAPLASQELRENIKINTKTIKRSTRF